MGRVENTERSDDTCPSEEALRLILKGVLPRATEAWTLHAPITLGRGEECTTVLDHSRVSRRHVEIYRQGPIFALRDLGSTNGTFVDGRRVEHCALRAGSVIRVGDWLGMVVQGDEGGSATFREFAPGVFGGSALRRAFEPLARAA